MQSEAIDLVQKRFQVIIFDLGDTLIYFDGDIVQAMEEGRQQMLRSLQVSGLNLGEEFLADFYARMQAYYRERDSEFIEYTVGYVLKATLADWGYTDGSEALQAQALETMHAVTQARWKPETDALPVLTELRRLGYRLGLVSNAADDTNIQVLVDKVGARDCFEVILSSAAIGVRKPAPKIFRRVLDQMGVQPEQAAMVGDTLGADILGAHNVGMFAIWITRRANRAANRDHLDTIRPDATIAALSELPGVLERLA
jgi:putative hydrolase of the HAD superfamily